MKTFNQFLLEMKDPVGSAQKYARRQMARDTENTSTSSGMDFDEDTGTLVPRLYIKTKGFDKKISDRVHNVAQKREDKIVGNLPWQEGKKLIAAREVPRTLSVRKLLPTQDAVDVGSKETLKTKIAYDPKTMQDRVRIFRLGGKNYIADGHHRVLGSILAKRKRIPVRVFDLDPPKKKKGRKNAK